MIPRLQERQKQTGCQQRLAEDQHGVRAPDTQQQWRDAASRDEGGDLHAIVGEILQQ
jgi:hypothetical protein